MIIKSHHIWIENNWINVDGVGRIGLYSPIEQTIMLDWSMKFIVGTNERIHRVKESEIIKEILKLFKDGK